MEKPEQTPREIRATDVSGPMAAYFAPPFSTIQGTFEIRHERYDGTNPPSFPADYSGRPELRPYLKPEDFIESEDPVLARKAEDLVRGAADSWDAAKRLSRWVAEEIGYGIPGGGSARNTYDLRQGECGAHSRLYAAFCRAVGIPSRVVWGCMYTPEKAGGLALSRLDASLIVEELARFATCPSAPNSTAM